MCLYWTFPHEAINGVLKGFAARNSNHRNVGTSLMKRHFLVRFLDITLGDQNIPSSERVLRIGSAMNEEMYSQQVGALLRNSRSLRRNVGYMWNWQGVWPEMVITFCDMSVWISIDVFLDENRVARIWARKMNLVGTVDSTGFPMYEFTDHRALLSIMDVLYVGAYSWLNNRSFITKTFDNK